LAIVEYGLSFGNNTGADHCGINVWQATNGVQRRALGDTEETLCKPQCLALFGATSRFSECSCPDSLSSANYLFDVSFSGLVDDELILSNPDRRGANFQTEVL